MNNVEKLFQASSDGKLKDNELRDMQKDALNFNFFSYRDANREQLEAFGKKMYYRVMDEVEVANPIPLFFDTVQGDLDTELEFQDVTGGRVYNWAYGTTRKASRLTMEAWTVKQSPRQVHFRLPVQAIQTGRVLLRDVTAEAARVILTHKVKLALDTFNAAYPAATSSFVTNAAGADLTQTALDSAIRRVRGLTGVRAIVGSYRALFPIEQFEGYETGSSTPTGFPDSVKEEIHKKGYIGQYRGIPIIRLKDFRDLRYNYSPIAGTDVYLVPDQDKKKFNVFAEYGSTAPEPPETHQNDQTISLYWYWEDGAALPAIDTKLQYAHRVYNCAQS